MPGVAASRQPHDAVGVVCGGNADQSVLHARRAMHILESMRLRLIRRDENVFGVFESGFGGAARG